MHSSKKAFLVKLTCDLGEFFRESSTALGTGIVLDTVGICAVALIRDVTRSDAFSAFFVEQTLGHIQSI